MAPFVPLTWVKIGKKLKVVKSAALGSFGGTHWRAGAGLCYASLGGRQFMRRVEPTLQGRWFRLRLCNKRGLLSAQNLISDKSCAPLPLPAFAPARFTFEISKRTVLNMPPHRSWKVCGTMRGGRSVEQCGGLLWPPYEPFSSFPFVTHLSLNLHCKFGEFSASCVSRSFVRQSKWDALPWGNLPCDRQDFCIKYSRVSV